uniref:DISC1 scaffold protein n=1 Tax=Homo sapiens TaxID=9606 RepID=H0Y7U2_HUMAN
MPGGGPQGAPAAAGGGGVSHRAAGIAYHLQRAFGGGGWHGGRAT